MKTSTETTKQVKKLKLFKVVRDRSGRISTVVGTIDELIAHFSYILECGKDHQSEKGNYKINTNPKGIKSLISNLEKSTFNCNGSASFYESDINDENFSDYLVGKTYENRYN